MKLISSCPDMSYAQLEILLSQSSASWLGLCNCSLHTQQLLTLCCCCFCLSSLNKALPDHMLADRHRRKPGGRWRRTRGSLALCSLTGFGYSSDPELLRPGQRHRQLCPVLQAYTCYLSPDPTVTRGAHGREPPACPERCH